MTPSIRNVVFDLGNVLIRLEHTAALAWLRQRGVRVEGIPAFLDASGLREHETGRLASAGFLDRVNALLERPVPREELERWWCSLFSPDESMLALARSLRPRYRVAILSNTGPMHWAQARRQFGLDEWLDGSLTSFDAGVMKPDPEIYRTAEQRLELAAGQTVFIDDLADNVAAARVAGWHAVHHRGYETTTAALKDLGIVLREPAS